MTRPHAHTFGPNLRCGTCDIPHAGLSNLDGCACGLEHNPGTYAAFDAGKPLHYPAECVGVYPDVIVRRSSTGAVNRVHILKVLDRARPWPMAWEEIADRMNSPLTDYPAIELEAIKRSLNYLREKGVIKRARIKLGGIDKPDFYVARNGRNQNRWRLVEEVVSL